MDATGTEAYTNKGYVEDEEELSHVENDDSLGNGHNSSSSDDYDNLKNSEFGVVNRDANESDATSDVNQDVDSLGENRARLESWRRTGMVHSDGEVLGAHELTEYGRDPEAVETPEVVPADFRPPSPVRQRSILRESTSYYHPQPPHQHPAHIHIIAEDDKKDEDENRQSFLYATEDSNQYGVYVYIIRIYCILSFRNDACEFNIICYLLSWVSGRE